MLIDNITVPRSRQNIVPSTRYRSGSTLFQTDCGSGKITVRTTERLRLDGNRSSVALRTTNLDFTTNNGQLRRFRLSVDLTQQKLQGVSGLSPLVPSIIAHRIVPDNAAVFVLVGRDDVAGLKKLVANGCASIWDCDRWGRSLLHVSPLFRSRHADETQMIQADWARHSTPSQIFALTCATSSSRVVWMLTQ